MYCFLLLEYYFTYVLYCEIGVHTKYSKVQIPYPYLTKAHTGTVCTPISLFKGVLI